MLQIGNGGRMVEQVNYLGVNITSPGNVIKDSKTEHEWLAI
jgi:hypothetical protein